MSDFHPGEGERLAHADDLADDVDGIALAACALDVCGVDVGADARSEEAATSNGERAHGIGQRGDAAAMERAEAVQVVRADLKGALDAAGHGGRDAQLRDGGCIVPGSRLAGIRIGIGIGIGIGLLAWVRARAGAGGDSQASADALHETKTRTRRFDGHRVYRNGMRVAGCGLVLVVVLDGWEQGC